MRKDKPDGANWEKTRINRINAKLGQMKSFNIDFFHKSGPLKGLPTKMHTILIMWAYSPYPSKIKTIKSKKLLNSLKASSKLSPDRNKVPSSSLTQKLNQTFLSVVKAVSVAI